LLAPALGCAAALAVALGAAAEPVESVAAETLFGSTRVIRVGPARDVRTIAEAARIANDGDVVEIDAGDYPDDVATWRQSRLVIRAVGGRARIEAPGANAEGKAIWVVKGDDVVIDGIEFALARVPDLNGAGIRHEGGRLTVRNCLFERNEMGLLTWSNEAASLVVERSEFRDNRVAGEWRPGQRIGHQLYVGAIGRLELRDSFVHGGAFGHLVKSRARENFVYNNTIADDRDGRASYELEFPNGGLAYVVGNVIAQSASSENADIVSFGAEGYRRRDNGLYLVNNTLVDSLPGGGNFVNVHPGGPPARALNNLLVGDGVFAIGTGGRANRRASPRDFAAASRGDYRLRAASRHVGTAADPGSANGVRLRPQREYVHPTSSRPVPPGRYSPGAFQSVAR
jgi:hypothetical protein